MEFESGELYCGTRLNISEFKDRKNLHIAIKTKSNKNYGVGNHYPVYVQTCNYKASNWQIFAQQSVTDSEQRTALYIELLRN